METLTSLLIKAMMSIIVSVVPGIESDKEIYKNYYEGVIVGAKITEDVTKPGYLVSPEVDRAIIASIRFYESRYLLSPKDGDCLSYRHIGVPFHQWSYMYENPWWCEAKGPMQLSYSTSKKAHYLEAVNNVFEEAGLPIVTPFSEKEIRNPETNIRLGYAFLLHWKNKCGGPPGVWITAWVRGRCSSKSWRTWRYIDFEGRRRCETATRILKETGTKPEGWYCGHEAGAWESTNNHKK